MKMTRLEWRYLQRIALDHPYFDTHKLPLTEKEAKAIVEANIKMTGKEFVDSIYAKLGMSRPEEKKDRFAWLRSVVGMLTVPPIRRIAIAVLVVILMTVFFAATPTGRAIAESAIQYIVRLFDKGAIASLSNNSEDLEFIDGTDLTGEEVDNCKDTVIIKDFNDFKITTGRTPFVLSQPCIGVSYDTQECPTLMSTYLTSDGEIIVYQVWESEEFIASSQEGYTVSTKDDSVYYSVDNTDGSITCLKIFNDSVVFIYADKTVPLERLINMVCD